MSEPNSSPPPEGQFLVYQAEDGKLKLEVRFEGETLWLTQQHMAELFQTKKQNIGQHLKSIFAEGELLQNSVVKDSFTTAADGKNYATRFYNLDAIIPVGNEFWCIRDFAKVLGYADYGNFQSVIESARTACFNSGQRVDDHFVEVTDMVEIGSGAQHPLKTIMMSRHSTLLPRLNDEVAALAAKVDSHLKKMGAAL
jgi:hypothetical protein